MRNPDQFIRAQAMFKAGTISFGQYHLMLLPCYEK